MARIDLALDEQKRTLDALLVKRARPDLGRGPAQPSAVRQAFDAYVRRGDEAALRQSELKAMSAGSDADGGYLVPDELDSEIGRRLSELYRLHPLLPGVSHVFVFTGTSTRVSGCFA